MFQILEEARDVGHEVRMERPDKAIALSVKDGNIKIRTNMTGDEFIGYLNQLQDQVLE